ncbi:antibiotic biosynthesis monooxygenase [Pleomorphomonas diazotrophica]|uniref:Antibiotic biosynthesis monooxygenase n=1 Tax=Pleomorphomonas diazotrophica TaxID=1166257 RepID=A0A1I4Q4S7_9HYPH|nr:antibiotic biosynthesis monooxygenase [Pleomorphomonas diazotrophica]PKR90931.1 antibiotic biosynthesis monooxygenase [Pleomorphomonas diazotrophica]SFM35108.1 Antibiotic biosynthesis monooxygenase [Pleomorphomonas diazotrophica]
MPVIRAQSGLITQINVFTVPAGGQDALIGYLSRAAEVAREVDGWISASLHRSLDGTRVVNYAQSADEEAARRVVRHLMDRGLIQGNKAYGQANPGLYDVVFTLERED